MPPSPTPAAAATPAAAHYEIRHRYTNALLYAAAGNSLKEVVEAAVAAEASLNGASLNGANLNGASLYRASLYRANLNGANLDGANLNGANLNGTNLNGANLNGTNLNGATLYRANLNGAKLPGFQIPQEGSLIVWKKLRHGVLAKLCIPAEAARTATPVGRKCRAAYADVLLLEKDGAEVAEGYSLHESSFRYAAGQRVTPAAYDGDFRQECLPGIHFFLTHEEAAAYN